MVKACPLTALEGPSRHVILIIEGAKAVVKACPLTGRFVELHLD